MNIIPLGARHHKSLPVPTQGIDYRLIKNVFMAKGVDFEPVRELAQQRWISTRTLAEQLIVDPALKTLWEQDFLKTQKAQKDYILKMATVLRFHCANGRIYETTPAVHGHVERQNPCLINTDTLIISTGKPVYIHLSNNAPQTFYIENRAPVVGAYIEYDSSQPYPSLQLHIEAVGVSWKIYVALSNLTTLEQIPMDMKLEHKLNRRALLHFLKLWSCWATKQFKETHYMEHDIIAANGTAQKERRLSGAYNRIMLTVKED